MAAFLCLLLLVVADLVSSQFDSVPAESNNPHGWNWDSGYHGDFGTYDVRIRCLGDFPPFLSPSSFTGYRLTSLLDFCGRAEFARVRPPPSADEASSSRLPVAGLGGYCSSFSIEHDLWFDPDHVSGIYASHLSGLSDVDIARLLQYCRTKCACTYEAEPDTYRKIRLAFNNEARYTELPYGREDRFPVDIIPTPPHGSSSYIEEYPLLLADHPGHIQLASRHFITSRRNFITCDGPLPPDSFIPPELYDITWPNLQFLCAAPIVSGTALRSPASAGGICQPLRSQSGPGQQPTGEERPTVVFPDELAHPAFNARAGNHGMLVSLWCHQHCHCSEWPDPSAEGEVAVPVRWLYDATTDFSGDGVRVSATITGADGRPTEQSATLLNPTDLQYNPLGLTQCQASNSCPLPKSLPSSFLPLPPLNDNVFSFSSPQSRLVTYGRLFSGAATKKQVVADHRRPRARRSCGATCSSNEDCGYPTDATGKWMCRCVADASMQLTFGVFNRINQPGVTARCLWYPTPGSIAVGVALTAMSQAAGGGG